MAVFNEAYYLKSKLAQLQSLEGGDYADWTPAMVRTAILEAGFASVEDHYQQYHLIEGTSANPYFNTAEYLAAKVHQLNSTEEGGRTDWTVEDVIKAFQEAGLTAEEHYERYGAFEKDGDGYLINPSNAFDANAYVEAKLAQLMATDPETYKDWTAEDVVDAFENAGLTPVEHYEQYGKTEAAQASIPMLQTVPVTQRVANDELRDGMDENVPSNYNKPVDAPENVTAAAAQEQGGVDKPCDVATTTDKPADPVAVDGDSDYVPVPGGGITDTNENPVELVTAEVKDADGNTVASASEYGVASTTKDADGNTVKTVQPVDSTGAVDADADPIQTVTTSEDGKTQLTETKVSDAQGNTVAVAEKTTTADDGSTVTDTVATATDANGNQVAKEETRVATDADGEVTGTNTTYTDENGATKSETTGDDPGAAEDPTVEPEPEPSPSPSPTPAADTTAPTMSKAAFSDATTLVVEFSENLNTTFDATLISLIVGEDDGATLAALQDDGTVSTATISGKNLTVTFDAAPNAAVTVTVGTGAVKDTAGNPIEEDSTGVKADAYTPGDEDVAAPVISDFAIDGKVITATVTDEDTDTSNLVLDDTKISVSIDGTPAADFAANLTDGTLTITLNEVPTAGAKVQVSLAAGAVSDGTNSSAETVSEEMTAGEEPQPGDLNPVLTLTTEDGVADDTADISGTLTGVDAATTLEITISDTEGAGEAVERTFTGALEDSTWTFTSANATTDGTVTLGADGAFTYARPAGDLTGAVSNYSITVTAGDGASETTSDAVTLETLSPFTASIEMQTGEVADTVLQFTGTLTATAPLTGDQVVISVAVDGGEPEVAGTLTYDGTSWSADGSFAIAGTTLTYTRGAEGGDNKANTYAFSAEYQAAGASEATAAEVTGGAIETTVVEGQSALQLTTDATDGAIDDDVQVVTLTVSGVDLDAAGGTVTVGVEDTGSLDLNNTVHLAYDAEASTWSVSETPVADPAAGTLTFTAVDANTGDLTFTFMRPNDQVHAVKGGTADTYTFSVEGAKADSSALVVATASTGGVAVTTNVLDADPTGTVTGVYTAGTDAQYDVAIPDSVALVAGDVVKIAYGNDFTVTTNTDLRAVLNQLYNTTNGTRYGTTTGKSTDISYSDNTLHIAVKDGETNYTVVYPAHADPTNVDATLDAENPASGASPASFDYADVLSTTVVKQGGSVTIGDATKTANSNTTVGALFTDAAEAGDFTVSYDATDQHLILTYKDTGAAEVTDPTVTVDPNAAKPDIVDNSGVAVSTATAGANTPSNEYVLPAGNVDAGKTQTVTVTTSDGTSVSATVTGTGSSTLAALLQTASWTDAEGQTVAGLSVSVNGNNNLSITDGTAPIAGECTVTVATSMAQTAGTPAAGTYGHGTVTYAGLAATTLAEGQTLTIGTSASGSPVSLNGDGTTVATLIGALAENAKTFTTGSDPNVVTWTVSVDGNDVVLTTDQADNAAPTDPGVELHEELEPVSSTYVEPVAAHYTFTFGTAPASGAEGVIDTGDTIADGYKLTLADKVFSFTENTSDDTKLDVKFADQAVVDGSNAAITVTAESCTLGDVLNALTSAKAGQGFSVTEDTGVFTVNVNDAQAGTAGHLSANAVLNNGSEDVATNTGSENAVAAVTESNTYVFDTATNIIPANGEEVTVTIANDGGTASWVATVTGTGSANLATLLSEAENPTITGSIGASCKASTGTITITDGSTGVFAENCTITIASVTTEDGTPAAGTQGNGTVTYTSLGDTVLANGASLVINDIDTGITGDGASKISQLLPEGTGVDTDSTAEGNEYTVSYSETNMVLTAASGTAAPAQAPAVAIVSSEEGTSIYNPGDGSLTAGWTFTIGTEASDTKVDVNDDFVAGDTLTLGTTTPTVISARASDGMIMIGSQLMAVTLPENAATVGDLLTALATAQPAMLGSVSLSGSKADGFTIKVAGEPAADSTSVAMTLVNYDHGEGAVEGVETPGSNGTPAIYTYTFAEAPAQAEGTEVTGYTITLGGEEFTGETLSDALAAAVADGSVTFGTDPTTTTYTVTAGTEPLTLTLTAETVGTPDVAATAASSAYDTATTLSDAEPAEAADTKIVYTLSSAIAEAYVDDDATPVDQGYSIKAGDTTLAEATDATTTIKDLIDSIADLEYVDSVAVEGTNLTVTLANSDNALVALNDGTGELEAVSLEFEAAPEVTMSLAMAYIGSFDGALMDANVLDANDDDVNTDVSLMGTDTMDDGFVGA